MKKVRFLMSGDNWFRIGSGLCNALDDLSFRSPLGREHLVSLTSGPSTVAAPTLVSLGEYDFSMITPTWNLYRAYKGMGPYKATCSSCRRSKERAMGPAAQPVQG